MSRRTGFLDKEFHRVREKLDAEWKRASRPLKNSASASALNDGPTQLVRAPTDPQQPPRLSPLLADLARKERERDAEAPVPQSMRSVSDPLPLPSSFPINPVRPALGSHRGSVDSVTSLPLLGMVRGVPVGNRVPLRVMNPGDRMSMSSSSGSAVIEPPKAKVPRSSPLRDGVAFNVPESNSLADPQTHTLQLPGRTASDSSGLSEGASSSGSSRKSRNRKDKERKSHVEGGEGGQEKILIVLLDEKDRPDEKGKSKSLPAADATWHGLERRLSTLSGRILPPPGSVHDSPWVGPLVHLDEDVTYLNTPAESESESDDDEDRRPGVVVPIKSLLSAMGYLTPDAAVMGGTPSPYGSYAALPGATPYSSPYVPAAPMTYSSPYVSPYNSPYNVSASQPPSRPQTPVSWGPPSAPASVPPWASPGGGYPLTNYTSPVPGGYSLYASPAVGYASPVAGYAASAGYATSASYAPFGAVYASPAALYASSAAGYASPYPNASPNLAAGYSSPYVPPLDEPGAGFYYS
ncbi:hypothetical protein B0H15DRAFT_652707 [Mycena belliarum]|uniref:Uncharacterized protein n=1 Tax=Mycena belliarum TaxID=1033014 RepID=A0AAD6XJF7_9AGAR|nr:hypothetical protein B0H15DRAFT_652707 [Mycena belliae]